ncbi:MAG: AAA family ATPase, partial [Candidatus Thorarchaeota archaeon]
MTRAEFYGLKMNPFEPTGAASGKYPFVKPSNFHIIEDKIEEAGIEKKLYALVVSSPHGAGKTTTMEYLKKTAKAGLYLKYRAPVILTRLNDLNLVSFVRDVLDEAKEITAENVASKGQYEQTPSRLRKKLVDTLLPIAQKHKLMLWIIDEFDILADQKEKDQKSFLQFLRSIIDDFAKCDVPIAFIMSHTKYSSRAFQDYLSKQHEPFKSRIVAFLTLAYSYEEVRQIVVERLAAAEQESRMDDLYPFTEDALQLLFEMMTAPRGTNELDNFRFFERICHFALVEGSKRKQKLIDQDLIKEIFNQYIDELDTTDERHLSIELTRQIEKLKEKPGLETNSAIIKGLLRGIERSEFLGGAVSLDLEDTYYVGGLEESGIEIGCLNLGLSHKQRALSLQWILSTNKSGVMQSDDFQGLNTILNDFLAREVRHVQARILSYVSSVETKISPSPGIDRIIWFPEMLADDLIGLGLASEEEIHRLVKGFDNQLAPMILQLITREGNDIAESLSQSCYELVQAIHVFDAIGRNLSSDSALKNGRKLFLKGGSIQRAQLRTIVRNGFAREEGTRITPTIPPAHEFLMNQLKDGPVTKPVMEQMFVISSNPIIKSAKKFG